MQYCRVLRLTITCGLQEKVRLGAGASPDLLQGLQVDQEVRQELRAIRDRVTHLLDVLSDSPTPGGKAAENAPPTQEQEVAPSLPAGHSREFDPLEQEQQVQQEVDTASQRSHQSSSAAELQETTQPGYGAVNGGQQEYGAHSYPSGAPPAQHSYPGAPPPTGPPKQPVYGQAPEHTYGQPYPQAQTYSSSPAPYSQPAHTPAPTQPTYQYQSPASAATFPPGPPTSAPAFPPTSAPAFPPTPAPGFPPTSTPAFPPNSATIFPPTSAPSYPHSPQARPPASYPAVRPPGGPAFPPAGYPGAPPTFPPAGPPNNPYSGGLPRPGAPQAYSYPQQGPGGPGGYTQQ